MKRNLARLSYCHLCMRRMVLGAAGLMCEQHQRKIEPLSPDERSEFKRCWPERVLVQRPVSKFAPYTEDPS